MHMRLSSDQPDPIENHHRPPRSQPTSLETSSGVSPKKSETVKNAKNISKTPKSQKHRKITKSTQYLVFASAFLSTGLKSLHSAECEEFCILHIIGAQCFRNHYISSPRGCSIFWHTPQKFRNSQKGQKKFQNNHNCKNIGKHTKQTHHLVLVSASLSTARESLHTTECVASYWFASSWRMVLSESLTDHVISFSVHELRYKSTPKKFETAKIDKNNSKTPKLQKYRKSYKIKSSIFLFSCRLLSRLVARFFTLLSVNHLTCSHAS